MTQLATGAHPARAKRGHTLTVSGADHNTDAQTVEAAKVAKAEPTNTT
jgi:hypothetical protein